MPQAYRLSNCHYGGAALLRSRSTRWSHVVVDVVVPSTRPLLLSSSCTRRPVVDFSSSVSSKAAFAATSSSIPMSSIQQQHQHQRRIAINSNDRSRRLLSTSNESPISMLNDVKGGRLNDYHHQHHYHHKQGNHNDQDINTATIAFEDPVQDLLLLPAADDNITEDSLRYSSMWLPPTVQPPSDQNDPFVLTRSEVEDLTRSIRDDLIGVDHPVLHKAAAYFFDTAAATKSGETTTTLLRIRPMMVMMLISRALSDATASGTTTPSSSSSSGNSSIIGSNSNSGVFGQVHDWQRPDLPAAQRRLAELSEMIHAGTLFHDDVTDEHINPDGGTPQGQQSSMSSFGNKTAILAGDYFLARSSLSLARLHNTQVSEIMSTSIEHLARGQVMQIDDNNDPLTDWSSSNAATMTTYGKDDDLPNTTEQQQRLLNYLHKIFYKSASLLAHTCRSAALLGDYSEDLVDASYRYGKHLGMAAQLVDDIATTTLNNSPHEKTMILLLASHVGMKRVKRLTRAHAEKAIDAALEMASFTNNNSAVYRDALVHLASQVAERTYR